MCSMQRVLRDVGGRGIQIAIDQIVPDADKLTHAI